MTRIPNPPVPGQNISVSFYRELVQYLRENRLVAGNNIRISRGVGGAVIDCTAQSKQTPQSGKAKDLGPFAPTYDDETGVMDGIGEGYLQTYTGTVSVAAISFPLAGLIRDADNSNNGGGVSSSDAPPTYSGVVAIKAPLPNDDDSSSDSSQNGQVPGSSDDAGNPELVGFADMSAMMAQQSSDEGDFAYIPIYLLDKSAVTLDFRLMSFLPSDKGAAIGVKTLNELFGNLEVVGGEKIKITPIPEKGFIKIEFDEDKKEDDADDTPRPDPCAHPGNPGGQNGSGVSEEFSSPDGGNVVVTISDDAGGVPADGSPHIGDDNCNCP